MLRSGPQRIWTTIQLVFLHAKSCLKSDIIKCYALWGAQNNIVKLRSKKLFYYLLTAGDLDLSLEVVAEVEVVAPRPGGVKLLGCVTFKVAELVTVICWGGRRNPNLGELGAEADCGCKWACLNCAAGIGLTSWQWLSASDWPLSWSELTSLA